MAHKLAGGFQYSFVVGKSSVMRSVMTIYFKVYCNKN